MKTAWKQLKGREGRNMKKQMKRTVSLILTALMILSVWPASAFAETGEEGALYWGVTAEEDFIISGNETDTADCTVKGSFSGNEVWMAEERPWDGLSQNVRNVYVKGNVAPTSTCNWFCNFSIGGVLDLSGLDTSHVTNMSCMFDG